MALVRNGAIAHDSWWLEAATGDPRPSADLPEGPVIVRLERWRADREHLTGRAWPLGVALEPAHDVGELAPDLHLLATVALRFEGFAEGRPYSQARLLRERHRYRGEIRAIGDVTRDRVAFMLRCGIDAIEARDGLTARAVRDAVAEISVAYQPAADGAGFAAHRRGWR